ncbi:hypothetical protein Golob_018108 [Gossypium lobatum]|uniref:Uncharacterized protein n=1 Tax=Gossypium lobatum TaxID=34289 RepID=A0A7J8M9E8_9ROSI|nr:hypothetical protein [Gossypium lobatum]
MRADEQMVEEQPRQKQRSSFGGFWERDEKAGIKKSSSCGAKTSEKAKKRIRKVEVEIAGRKGYTKSLKQWVMEETTIMESAILEMEIEVGRVKRMNGMHSLNNQIINDYIKSMLGVF